MQKFKKMITKHRKLIVVLSILLLIPAIIGYINTKINYDILVYLPEDIETIQGQNILTKDFGIGSFAFVMIDHTKNYDILELKEELRKIDSVNMVASLADITDTTIPMDLLPDDVTKKLYQDERSVIALTFSSGMSDEDTMKGLEKIRKVVGDATKVSGMSTTVLDTRDLSSKEMLVYIVIASILCFVVLLIATDSYLIPIFLLGNIGVAILYNMGTNFIFGNISYITKAISAVLQLGVTMDFSIFLYHKYTQAKEKYENRTLAMEEAIEETFHSVLGSSLTTIAGFLALCMMQLTLGKDIGLVMAKGVVCGLICVLTLFPSLLLVFDPIIEKTKHRSILPEFKTLQNFSIKHHKFILIVFLILLIPAIYGNNNTKVYYNLDKSLPSTLASSIANFKLKDEFQIVSPEIILLDKNLKVEDTQELVENLKHVKGIDLVLSPTSLLDFGLPLEMLPEDLTQVMENDQYQLILLNSIYDIATPKLNQQINQVNKLVKKYDTKAIVAGEGPLMKDLTEISDQDFKNVNYASIGVIFILMLLVLKSASLPIILICAIEFAILSNMSVAFFTNTTLPFIASIVIGTIQLGATIDYAILMSTKYLEVRKRQKDKTLAMKETLQLTVPSIIVSALCFFAATIGVGVYSKIDLIGAICKLLSRGSIISMLVVILILPALLLVTDRIIMKTTLNMRRKIMKNKILTITLTLGMLILPMNVQALTKEETVYTNLNKDGTHFKTVVTNRLSDFQESTIEDTTQLKEILNLNGKETFTLNNQTLTWNTKGKDIFYQGTIEKSLPITTKIQYYLNGKEISQKELVGEKGTVKIVLTFENHESHQINQETLYTPFVVTLGMILDKYQENITITNGKIVRTGSKNIIVALATPGLYESTSLEEVKDMNRIELTFETKKYKQPTMYVVATPKLLDQDNLTVFTKLDSLYQNVDLLKKNIDLIDAGARELELGSNQLLNGAQELSTNLNTINQYLKELTTGTYNLSQGLSQVLTALDQAEESLNNTSNDSSLRKLQLLKENNTNTILKLQGTNQQLEEQYLTYQLNSLTVEQIKNLALDTNTINNLITLKNTYEGNVGFIQLLSANNQAIEETIRTLGTTTTQLQELLIKLKTALLELDAGSHTIYTSTSKISTAINALYQGSTSLVEGTNSLVTETKTLKNGISTYNQEGITTLVNYSNRFKTTTNKLKTLAELSNQYKGFATDNANSTTFVSVIK